MVLELFLLTRPATTGLGREMTTVLSTPIDERDHAFESALGMPLHQTNAHVAKQLTVRIGIPHRSGRLTAHAFDEDFPVMVSAAAFWHQKSSSFKIPHATNLTELDLALDSAGYTAIKSWKAKGRQSGMASVFPWSYSQYIELACLLGVNWWSQPDLCCEPDIAGTPDEVAYRVNATATLLEGCLRLVYDWQNQLSKSDTAASARVAANLVKPPVPVLQGWTPADYMRSLEQMLNVWERWRPWLASPSLIGVGSVCRRPMNHPKHGLRAILLALEKNIPSGCRIHLFGVKGTCLAELKKLPWVASTDSMAYDLSARLKALKAGHSNSASHRCGEMTRWMQSANKRIDPSAAAQTELVFST